MTHEEGNSTDADNFSNTSILELRKKYGISRTSLYRRMRYLQIKTKKIGGKAYLNAQQVVYMDGLHEYITTNKKMDGYIKPESIRPDRKQKQTIQVLEDELTTEDNLESVMVVPQNSVFEMPAQTTKLQAQTIINEADIETKLEALQWLKEKRLAVIKLTRAYEEDPSLLPPKIWQEIEEAEMAAISTRLSHRADYDPKFLAQLVIQTL